MPAKVPPVIVGMEQPEAALLAWARRETAAWKLHSVDRATVQPVLAELNRNRPGLMLLRFGNGSVTIEPKPDAVPDDPGRAFRKARYLTFFRIVAAKLPVRFSTSIGMHVDDGSPADVNIPLLAFQKRSASRNLLVPDIDFLINEFYETAYRDSVPYSGKYRRAVFTGSTTGAMISLKMAQALSLPRLRAAAFFAGSTRVDFRLPRIVQCLSPEAEAFLAAQPFCQRPTLEWPDQFANRFLLSMDGNGATCSRVFIALRSNSVLLKYDSDYLLHYFQGMQPWKHYVPVSSDDEVETLLDEETRNSERFEQIADAGKQFAETYLTKNALISYTATLIRRYERAILSP